MITLEPKTYDHFIFDCDGVVLDSNEIKKCNIREAVKEHIDAERLEEFLQFFTQGNGRPREVKIRRYFDDESIINTILKRYNDLNLGALRRAPVIAGIVEVLKVLKQAGAHSIVLSGAEEDELRDILGSKGLLEYFSSIYGGPKDKKSHLNELKSPGDAFILAIAKLILKLPSILVTNLFLSVA